MEKLQEYGKIGIITHLSLSWSIFAGTYLLVRNSNKTNQIVSYLNLSSKIPKGASAFVISAVIYKALMPARIALTLVTLPVIIKTFNLEVPEVQEQKA